MSKEQDNKLVLYKPNKIGMNIEKIEKPENSDKGTCTKITSVWSNFTYYDKEGIIWVDSEKLHLILRTTKSNAKYAIVNIDDKNKSREGNKIYIRAYVVGEIIDKYIQREKIGKRKEYLKYSERVYTAIRDSEEIVIKQTKYQISRDEDRRKLKNRRIKKYNIEYDELTGEGIKKNTAEFAHIKSYALFREVANDIENELEYKLV
ncbi:MAG: hypothetical protein E7214_15100 [Clostridium sp.]|nr:hypothetical protein [Clostridium sp.]